MGLRGPKAKPNAGFRKFEYQPWRAMISRCTYQQNLRYKDYGGRGVTVCPRWLTSFASFLEDMGPRPVGKTSTGKRNEFSLDRFPDVNGNYEPGNCRWATWDQQNKNKRPKPKKMPRRRKASRSRFLGVSWVPAKGVWLVKVAGRYVGTFRDESSAGTAYNFACLERFGAARARYNTPDGKPLLSA